MENSRHWKFNVITCTKNTYIKSVEHKECEILEMVKNISINDENWKEDNGSSGNILMSVIALRRDKLNVKATQVNMHLKNNVTKEIFVL